MTAAKNPDPCHTSLTRLEVGGRSPPTGGPVTPGAPVTRPERQGQYEFCNHTRRAARWAFVPNPQPEENFSGWLDFRFTRPRRPRRFQLRLDELDPRIVPAVTASFLPGPGVLTIIGDSLNNTITVSRDAAGQILVNGGAVAVQGGTPTVANTASVQVFGQGGNDTITLNEANGALPAALLFGGAGNDILTGGSGGDQLHGDAGNDILLGKGGLDSLFGGDGSDILTGGDGDDQVFGEAGNDRMIWNPGDDTDLNEGGDGLDTVEVNGGNGAECFTATPNGTRVRFDRVTPALFSIDIEFSENLVVNMNGMRDSFTAGNGWPSFISDCGRRDWNDSSWRRGNDILSAATAT